MKRFAVRGFISVLTLSCLFQVVPRAGSQVVAEPDNYRIAVNVDLVEIYATVLDRQDRAVADLRQEHFEIREDGVPQTIRVFQKEDIPVAVGLVVDHSSSVGRKLPEVIAAARAFVQSSSPNDQMFVVNFNEHVTLGLPANTAFTNRADVMERAIANARTTGQTALYDAVMTARKHLQTATWTKRVLVVISDGGDNASRLTLADVLKLADHSGTLIYTIGIYERDDPDRNPEVLRRLARATGGEAYFPAELKEIPAVTERIAREIRSQYTLGYVSTQVSKPGTLRKIRVTAAAEGRGKLTVRARTGYIDGSRE